MFPNNKVILPYMKTYSYRLNRFAEVEGNNALGWYVINMVTGLQQETIYPTYADAKAAAHVLLLHYGALERGY